MDALIIRFSSLGDVILSSAVVEALRCAYPQCTIHFLTKRQYEQVFEGDERISRTIGFDNGESPLTIVKRLGRRRFDVIIDLQSNTRSFFVRLLLSSSRTMKVNKHNVSRRIMILTRNLIRCKNDVLANYLDTLKPLGITQRILPRILPADESIKESKRLLAREQMQGIGRIIGIAPGSKQDTKRWVEESFALLADTLADRGDIPVFVGDSNDIQVIERIQSRMRNKSRSLAGELTLTGTIGFISRLQGIITNDSGPMHIAGAVGVPFVAVFGPTHPDLGFCPGYPRGNILKTDEPCSPCSLHGKTPCRKQTRRCMEDITPAMVIESLDSLLD